MKKIIVAIAILLFGASNGFSASSRAQQEAGLPSLFVFNEAVKTFVLSKYPAAQFSVEKNKIHFEYRTQIFKIRYPLKTGKLQNPVEVRGPNKNGIVGDILMFRGNYQGQTMDLAAGQTFDEQYFNRLVLTPESQKLNCYLHVTLLYPKDTSPEFIKAFAALVNDFESYLLQAKQK